jgi:hypothetical protein
MAEIKGIRKQVVCAVLDRDDDYVVIDWEGKLRKMILADEVGFDEKPDYTEHFPSWPKPFLYFRK